MLRCWIFGHETDELASRYGHHHCRWCDCDDAYLPFAHGSWRFDGLLPSLRRLTWPLRWRLERLWRATGRCPWGGEREGWGHSPDCIPF